MSQTRPVFIKLLFLKKLQISQYSLSVDSNHLLYAVCDFAFLSLVKCLIIRNCISYKTSPGIGFELVPLFGITCLSTWLPITLSAVLTLTPNKFI